MDAQPDHIAERAREASKQAGAEQERISGDVARERDGAHERVTNALGPEAAHVAEEARDISSDRDGTRHRAQPADRRCGTILTLSSAAASPAVPASWYSASSLTAHKS